jgi:hypothetical protein
MYYWRVIKSKECPRTVGLIYACKDYVKLQDLRCKNNMDGGGLVGSCAVQSFRYIQLNRYVTQEYVRPLTVTRCVLSDVKYSVFKY